MTFDAVAIIIDILEELGYTESKIENNRAVSGFPGPREYYTERSFVRFQLPYGYRDYRRYCILRVNGQQIHIHGSEVDCSYIDLADPGSINRLRIALTNTEKPNGHPNKS